MNGAMELPSQIVPAIDDESEFEKKLRLRLFQCDLSFTCRSFATGLEKTDASSTAELNDSHTSGINSMNLSRDGNYLAAAVNCDSVALIDLVTCKESNFAVKKYGIGTIKFVSHRQAIHTSTKINHALRMIDFDKPSEYVRFFKGHGGPVSSMDVSPSGKNIISSSGQDRNFSLWDISTEKPIAMLDIPVPNTPFTDEQFKAISEGIRPRIVTSPRTVVTFHPSSYIFALASTGNPGFLKLYDMRNYTSGPFLSTHLDTSKLIHGSLGDERDEQILINASCSLGADFTEISFSPDASKILLNTDGPIFYVICATSGRIHLPIVRSYDYKTSHFHDKNMFPQVAFTPDSQYLLGGNGSDDGQIHVWSAFNGAQVNTIKQMRPLRNEDFVVNFISHHPTKMKIITSGSNNIDIYRPLYLTK